MPKVVKEAGQTDWIGMMSLPRVIEQIDNHIYFRVHPSVEKYFNREVSAKDGKMPDCPCRIKTELKEDENLDVGGYKICHYRRTSSDQRDSKGWQLPIGHLCR